MHTCNPIAFERLRQEVHHESESWLDYSLNNNNSNNKNKEKPKKRTKDNMKTVEGERRDRGSKIN